MRKAISGASRSYINFLPSLANREAIMFGQGVSTPMRMKFLTIPQHELPANHLMEEVQGKDQSVDDKIDLATILHDIRYPKMEENNFSLDSLSPLPGDISVGQKESISDIRDGDVLAKNEELFAQNAPLRRQTDNATASDFVREGRRQNDSVRQTTTPPPLAGDNTPSGNSLVNRFRKS
ncbi:MAG: hypothetical protein AAF412_04395 [Pseudomonadota bacterium]